MQVLEGIFSLDREQKKKFLESADELPLAELGLDDKDVLITEGDIVSVYKDFLDESRYNTKLKNITHLGWLVLLAKVYEADKSTGFIVFDSQHEIDREKIKSDLKEIIRIIKSEQKKIRVDKKSFRLMVWPNSFLYGKRKMLIKFLINWLDWTWRMAQR